MENVKNPLAEKYQAYIDKAIQAYERRENKPLPDDYYKNPQNVAGDQLVFISSKKRLYAVYDHIKENFLKDPEWVKKEALINIRSKAAWRRRKSQEFPEFLEENLLAAKALMNLKEYLEKLPTSDRFWRSFYTNETGKTEGALRKYGTKFKHEPAVFVQFFECFFTF